MNRIFAAWTALAVVFLALVVADQEQDWKRLQAEFRELELERLRTELDAARRLSDAAAELGDELEQARQRFAERRDEARRLERQLARARHAAGWAAEELARLRSRGDGGEAVRGVRQRLEELLSEEREAAERLADLRGELTRAETRQDEGARSVETLARRIAELERGAFWRRLPGLRGLDPAIAVVEETPPGLLQATPAGFTDRVDRCRTCHLRSHEARSGSEAAWPAPFAPHPGPLVGDAAPHPTRDFGCTACHGGDGRATDFAGAGHWPATAEQEAAWAERWGYSRTALPRSLILPAALAEAGCTHCHASLEHGQRLVRRMGCDGCHAIDPPALERLAATAVRRGPPLDRLAAKTTPEWTFHWIAAPRRFRPTTWMPHLFPAPAGDAESATVIRAMVGYLWSRADGGPAAEPPPAGDAGKGAELFATVGCTGCHLLDAAARRDGADFERLHGPNLARTGNKVRPGWLYAWLRDPRSHRSDTPMPDLRLSRDEAADLTAFLMASRDPQWEDLELPAADAAAREELVRELLEDELTLAGAAARLAEMSSDEKDLYLGRRSLEAYGCHGCHRLPGLADAPAVAGPLSGAGSDPGRWLPAPGESAGTALAHRPRPGRPAAPDYGWSDGEATAVLAALLSWTPPVAEPWRRAQQGEQARNLATGRRLLAHYGCLGCHRLEGRGGAIAATLAADEPRPPDLSSTGARLQPAWLFAYLHDPAAHARRPWLRMRMPTFHLQPEEANALVRFFAAREGQPLFAAPPPAAAKRDVEVGRAVAAMLQCDACHADARDADRLATAELAPSYRSLSERLRPGWVVDWILDPHRFVPDTAMPVTFDHDAAGAPDSSYLKATISAPMFGDWRARLLQHFDSEQELLAYLEDAPRVAVALRDYLWSLE